MAVRLNSASRSVDGVPRLAGDQLGLAGRENQVARENGRFVAGPGLQGEDGRFHDFPAIDHQLVALREYDVGGTAVHRDLGLRFSGLGGEGYENMAAVLFD